MKCVSVKTLPVVPSEGVQPRLECCRESKRWKKMKGMDTMSMAPKAETIAKFARKDGDTGSPEVQIALMTARIQHLTEHLKRNRKDYSTQTGLLALVNRRKKLLAYLSRENYDRYVALCAELGIRRK